MTRISGTVRVAGSEPSARRRRTIGGATLGSLILCAACIAVFNRSDGVMAQRLPASGKVKRVSGDHLSLNDGRNVEFAAVRLPYDDEPYAADARRVLSKWVLEEHVRLVYDELRDDRKQRSLAYVYANDSLLNERLVREGLAFVKLRDGNRRFEGELLAAQAEGMEAGRGMWSLVKPNQAGPFVTEPVRGTFHAATCRGLAGKSGLGEVANARDALLAGLAPCNLCKPLAAGGAGEAAH